MEYQNILLEIKDRAAWITVNRPYALNALNTPTILDLDSCLDEVEGNEKIRVVTITGAGEKAFVSGADLNEIREFGVKKAIAYSKRGHRMIDRIEKMRKPVIAAINGFALGGGCELALACTFRIMSENAKLGLPEILIGALPGLGGTQRLPRLIGKSRALWYTLTGETIDAKTALEIGLVNKVVSPKNMEKECWKLIDTLVQKSPLGISLMLRAINSGIEMDLERGLELESAFMAILAATDDPKEGIKAFFEREHPTSKMIREVHVYNAKC